MKAKLALIITLILLINIVSVSAITGSIGNARMVLYPEVNGLFATEIEKSILVKNVNDVPIEIALEPDEEGAEFIEIIDKEFILQPGSERRAMFVVKVRKAGTYEGKINVFFKPTKESEPGVALSSTIVVIAKKDQDYEETEDEEEIEEEEDDEGVDVSLGGDVNKVKEESGTGLLLLTISTIVLLVILGYLLYLMNKKGEKINAKKSKTKK